MAVPQHQQQALPHPLPHHPGPAVGVDIFAAAEALAGGQSLAPEDLATEHVPAFEFLAEATELLSDVKQQQQELQVCASLPRLPVSP